MGTVVNTIGTGGDYATVSAWVTATAVDCVTATTIYEGRLLDQAHTESASQVTASGATTNATYYRHLTVATSARHHLRRDTGGRCVGFGLIISEPYFRVTNIAIQDIATITPAILVEDSSVLVAGCLITDCAENGINFVSSGSPTGLTIVNCAIHNVAGNGILLAKTGASVIANTITNTGIRGIRWNATANPVTRIQNNLVGGCATADFSGTASQVTTKGYNLSSDATAGTLGGTGALSSKALANQILVATAGSEYARLKQGADAIDAGTNLASLGYTTDALGTTRDDPWDIGAHNWAHMPTAAAGDLFNDGALFEEDDGYLPVQVPVGKDLSWSTSHSITIEPIGDTAQTFTGYRVADSGGEDSIQAMVATSTSGCCRIWAESWSGTRKEISDASEILVREAGT